MIFRELSGDKIKSESPNKAYKWIKTIVRG